MILNEDRQLYKGVFWIVDRDNLENNENYCFTIPSDQYGNVDSTGLDLNAESGTTYNHEKLWDRLPHDVKKGKQYNYFPRGRVEIQNSNAVVYLNPWINTEEIQQFIVNIFNLIEINGIESVRFHSDGSNHYKCYLDVVKDKNR